MSSPEARLLHAIGRIAEITAGRSPVGVGHDDADEVHGTIASDDAIGFDPMPLLRSLDDHGSPVVIIGQVAGILHGSAELTGDLDLLWSGEVPETSRMAAAFAALDATLTDDDGAVLDVTDASFALPKVQFHTATVAGDCCTPALPWGDLDVRGFLDRAESAIVDGVRLHYLALDDLITMRQAVGRPKDLRRIAELQSLDV